MSKYSAQYEWNKRNPEKTRLAYRKCMLKRRYGITLEQYEAMLESQNGKCAICKGDCLTGRNLAVDHDHETGKVRGLLCSKCNQGLGQLNNIELLQRAIDYLKESC